MRLLTRQETGVLKGELNRLNLPKKTSLYICPGLPQVFRHVVSDNKEHFENSWLYIPLDMIKDMRQNLIVNSKNPNKNYITPEPIEIDDFNFYPILVNGDICGFLAIDNERQLHLTKRTTRDLIDGISFFMENQKRNDQSKLMEQVIDRLFKNDIPFDKYLKEMLKMFNRQFDRSCVAIYFEEDEITKLRMVVGDLLHVDNMPSEASAEILEQWRKAIERQNYFVPSYSLPNHPTLLNAPPQFNFVHPSLKSKKTKYTIVQTISGEIEYPSVENILWLAEVTSKIESTKFISGRDIATLYDELLINNRLKYTFDDLLKEIFKKVNAYTNLSRLVLYQPDKLSRIICCDEKVPKLITTGQNVVDCDLGNRLNHKNFYIKSGIDPEKAPDKLKNDYTEFNIRSECYCSLTAPDNSTFYLIFSCEDDSEATLLSLKDYINNARVLLQNYLNLVFTMQSDDKAEKGIAITNQKLISARQDTINLLSEGYYHDVYDMISVILGQSELLKEKVVVCNENELPSVVNASVLKVEQAADDIITYLDIIKQLGSRSSEDLKQFLSVKDLLGSLPLLMHGYSKQLVDTRGIFLKLAFSNINNFDFKIAQNEVYDYILPVIIALFKTAEKSGAFTLKYTTSQKANSIKIEYETEMIEQRKLLLNLESAFDSFEINRQDDRSVVMPLPFGRLIIRDESSNISAVIYEKLLVAVESEELEQIVDSRS